MTLPPMTTAGRVVGGASVAGDEDNQGEYRRHEETGVAVASQASNNSHPPRTRVNSWNQSLQCIHFDQGGMALSELPFTIQLPEIF